MTCPAYGLLSFSPATGCGCRRFACWRLLVFSSGMPWWLDGQRQYPRNVFVAAALAQRELAVRLVAAHADGGLECGGSGRPGLAHDQVDGDRRATMFGRGAAQDPTRSGFARGQAADGGQCVAGIAEGRLPPSTRIAPSRAPCRALALGPPSPLRAPASDAGQLVITSPTVSPPSASISRRSITVLVTAAVVAPPPDWLP